MSRTHATVAISLLPELRDEARQRAEELGFGNSFSAYIARLIAEDLRQADSLRDAPATVAPPTPRPVSYAPKPKKRPRK